MFNSSDPLLNAAMFTVAALIVIVLFVVSAIVAIPLAVAALIGYFVWKANFDAKIRGPATSELLAAAQVQAAPEDRKFLEDFAVRLLESLDGSIAHPLLVSILDVAEVIYKAEDLTNPLPPIPPTGTIEEARYRDFLEERGKKLANLQHTLDVLTTTLGVSVGEFARTLPTLARTHVDDWHQLPHIPLIDLIGKDIPDAITTLVRPFFSEQAKRAGLFRDLRKQIEANFEAAKVPPAEARGTPHDLVRTYLKDTPFPHLFYAPVPFTIPRRAFTEHGAIFAPSGHGKTQLLQSLILNFLNEPDPPAMFILDSQGSMLRKIEKLEAFATRLKDRLVVLEPPEPALNFFHFDGSNVEVVELANYLFAALDRQLTAKQGTAIPYLLKLLQQIPGATLDTLREIMDDKPKTFEQSPHYDAIMQLDRRAQDFFRHQFYGADMKATRQQVASRLYTILGNDNFVQMFAAKENRFNAFEAMQQKKIVLINTSNKILGKDGSSIFGRYMISQVLAGAYRRDPDATNHLAVLILDEAFEYFDDKTELILSQARKYGVGLLFATQWLEQMPSGVKAAVNSSTAIKMAGPVAYSDASLLAREMYTTPEFIRSMQPVDRSHTEFACHVRGLTSRAVKLTIPYGMLEREPTMPTEAHRAFREANRRRYGAEPEASRAPEAAHAPAPGEPAQSAPAAHDAPPRTAERSPEAPAPSTPEIPNDPNKRY